MSIRQHLSEIARGWVKAKSEKFTKHPIANQIRNGLKEAVEHELESRNKYLIESSAGRGNWADVPWLSILNPEITTSTQEGIYPVYLFRADGTGVYLSLGFGTTRLEKQCGSRKEAKKEVAKINESILSNNPKLKQWSEKIDLRANTPRARSYEWASAGAKFYPLEDIPSEEKLVSDLKELLEIYANIDAEQLGLKQKKHPKIQSLPKPFILLAGISGTGKTRFVREQAKATGCLNDTYCLTSVRPDWHEPSDLLGYVSRLGGEAEYVTTDVLQFIAKAWLGIADAGFTIGTQSFDGQDGRLVVRGSRDELDGVPPYWLCLDEMNLAPVEQYFADYLSVIETCEWQWDGDDFAYRSDPLLKPATINAVANKTKLRADLGFASSEYDALWGLISTHGLSIPFNLMVAGTVNMDETTHGFSRKVIDRALSFDFGAFFPNDYGEFFTPTSQNKSLTYPVYAQASKEDFANTYDADGAKTIAFLQAVNSVLKSTPFELAYRALNELLLAVVSNQPQDELTLQAVWDDFMMCKVLPRIEGDEDKLRTPGSDHSLLKELEDVLKQHLTPIWGEEESSPTARPDLYRESIGEDESGKTIRIACRTKQKLEWMRQRLESATFTSFWP